MPIYAYACQACGHQMDKIQKFSDAPLVQCPECHEDALKKQLTAPSFKLKGTGWYETDFKNNGKKPADTKASASTNSASASTATTTTTKTDTDTASTSKSSETKASTPSSTTSSSSTTKSS